MSVVSHMADDPNKHAARMKYAQEQSSGTFSPFQVDSSRGNAHLWMGGNR